MKKTNRRNFVRTMATTAASVSILPFLRGKGETDKVISSFDLHNPLMTDEADKNEFTQNESKGDPVLRAELIKSRWSLERAFKYMERFEIIKGCNYVPAYAHNHSHMWYDLKKFYIEKEIEWAKDIGINSLRLFFSIPDLMLDNQEEKLAKLDWFMDLAGKNGMTIMFTSVASVVDPKFDLKAPNEPVINYRPGIHGGQWKRDGSIDYTRYWPDAKPSVKKFVQDLVGRYKNDQRIIAWDLVNEAYESDIAFMEYMFACAREIDPIQPLTSSWRAPDISDIYSFHNYHRPGAAWNTAWDWRSFDDELELATASGRPMVCTEFMARTIGSTLENTLPYFSKYNINWYFWGLCAGSANYIFPWSYLNWWEGSPVPKDWFHCILYPDGTPYRPEEIELIRSFKFRPL